jgi:hypothetical protein
MEVSGVILSSSTKVYSSVFRKQFKILLVANGGIDNSVTTCAYKRTGFAGGYIGKISKTGGILGAVTRRFDNTQNWNNCKIMK